MKIKERQNQINGESFDRYMQATVGVGAHAKGSVGISDPYTGNFSVNDLREAFEDGENWADDNPQQWIEVSDMLPETNKHVLVTNSDGWIKVGYWDGEEWYWADGYPVGRRADTGDISYSSYSSMADVVAWMPIPRLPKSVEI